MSNTTQVLSTINRKLSRSAKLAGVALLMAFCPAILPLASANCRSNAGAHSGSVPTVPAAFAHDAGAARGPVSIVGLWNVTFTSEGQVVDVAFDAWHADGIEVLNDFTDPIEGNVCLGVWQQTGPRSYKLKHPSWYFDATGTLQGTVIIRETVHVSPDGDSFYGAYTYDIFDVAGNFQVELSGTVKGTRVKVDF